jgi:hypothetical protein
MHSYTASHTGSRRYSPAWNEPGHGGPAAPRGATAPVPRVRDALPLRLVTPAGTKTHSCDGRRPR